MPYQKTIELDRTGPQAIAKLQRGQWVSQGGARGVFCGVRRSGSVVVAWKENWRGRHRSYRTALMNYGKGD